MHHRKRVIYSLAGAHTVQLFKLSSSALTHNYLLDLSTSLFDWRGSLGSSQEIAL